MLSLCAAAQRLGNLRNSRGTWQNSSGRGAKRAGMQEGAVQEFRLSGGNAGTRKEISQGVKSGVRDGCQEKASYTPAVLLCLKGAAAQPRSSVRNRDSFWGAIITNGPFIYSKSTIINDWWGLKRATSRLD